MNQEEVASAQKVADALLVNMFAGAVMAGIVTLRGTQHGRAANASEAFGIAEIMLEESKKRGYADVQGLSEGLV
jgi:citrate synthase